MTLHERLVAKWSDCKFGVKQRIFNDEMPQASVQYIISNPKYGDVKKMEWLIDTIDKHVKIFKKEALEMTDKIESI